MILLVKPFELLWRGVNRLRRAAYRRGLLHARRLPRPVISVGNLAAGGTGKTPAVIALCRFLKEQGLRPVVLTRGYRRSGPGGLVQSADPDLYGDEPVVIKLAANVDVIVGVKRYANATHYLSHNDCDVFVLDDGFQHLQLARDLDIVIDTPATIYREGRSALRDAGLVVPRRIRLSIPDWLRHAKLFAFAGLGDNEQFFQALRAEGLSVVGTRRFPDHHRYRAADIVGIEQQARRTGATAIVTTGKDAVKLRRDDMIPVEAEFVFEPAVLEAVLAAVRR